MKLKISQKSLELIQNKNTSISKLTRLLKSFFKEGISDEDFYNLLWFTRASNDNLVVENIKGKKQSPDLKNKKDLNYLIKYYSDSLVDRINNAFLDGSLKTNDDGSYALDIEIDQEEVRMKPEKPKKPSFYFFKSFLRLFSKNLFKDEFDEYNTKLQNYENSLGVYENLKKAGYVVKTNEKVEKKQEKQVENNNNQVTNSEEPIINIKEESKMEKIETTETLNQNIKPKDDFEITDEMLKDEELMRDILGNINDTKIEKTEPKKSKINRNNPTPINLRIMNNNESVEDYANDIMSRRVNLDISEKTIELIALSTFNLEQLNEIKNFVNQKNDPRLMYLNEVVDEKVSNLTNKNNDIFNSKNVKHYAKYIRNMINDDFITSVKSFMIEETSSYQEFESDPSKIKKSGSRERLKAINKIDNYDNKNIVLKANNHGTKLTNTSVVLKNPIKTEIQSTDCGCWSCSLNVLLKSEGVDDLSQEDIRAYRPKDRFDTKKLVSNPNKLLMDRLQFSKRASTDVFNEINDYTDIIHKKTNNIAFKSKQITNSIDYVYNEAKRILEENKKPISFLYRGHYRTLIGVDNGNFIFEDSQVGKIIDGYATENYYVTDDYRQMQVKYPNYSVMNKDHFDNLNHQIVISWLEKIDDNKIDEYLKNNLKDKERGEYFLRSEGTLFSKIDLNNNGAYVEDDIILPNKCLEKVKAIDNYLNGTINNIDNNIGIELDKVFTDQNPIQTVNNEENEFSIFNQEKEIYELTKK